MFSSGALVELNINGYVMTCGSVAGGLKNATFYSEENTR